ncbi:DUF2924 domain-containing protein [Brevundimonas poindexterae]|uniref:DUF2924 domain-containing protein n=1 Tax=Brevundimonas poindexterae TaxID=74325 RepID=UPI001CFD6A7E|nr:DUF2924 domain-containing protein [Brevundimonas poindexterae]
MGAKLRVPDVPAATLKPADLEAQWSQDPDVEKFIKSLESAEREALRYFWRRRWRSEPPRLLITKLRRLIAYKFQSEETESPVPSGEGAALSDPQGGAVVYRRTWKGEEHVVVETAQGLLHKGTHYRSLSAIAREITGTRWNGLVFFSAPQLRRRRKPLPR